MIDAALSVKGKLCLPQSLPLVIRGARGKLDKRREDMSEIWELTPEEEELNEAYSKNYDMVADEIEAVRVECDRQIKSLLRICDAQADNIARLHNKAASRLLGMKV